MSAAGFSSDGGRLEAVYNDANESPIDDSDDLEDSTEGNDPISFERVHVEKNLVPLQSLITIKLAEQTNQQMSTRTVGPTNLPHHEQASPNLCRVTQEAPSRFTSDPPRFSTPSGMTQTPHVTQHAIHSPRTVQRHILSNEMTDSLRNYQLSSVRLPIHSPSSPTSERGSGSDLK